MKATILEILPRAIRYLVYFSCSAGRGRGMWCQPTYMPVVGHTYDIELDISIPLEITKSAKTPAEAPEMAAALKTIGEDVKVTALIEAVDEDGMACLRLSTDCLILVESHEGKVKPGEYVTLLLKADQLLIYPVA